MNPRIAVRPSIRAFDHEVLLIGQFFGRVCANFEVTMMRTLIRPLGALLLFAGLLATGPKLLAQG